MIKLIASDMDGTLLNKDGTIHERNISAIKKAIEKGIIFVPATGRANNTIPSQIFEHFPIRYNLSSNGAAIYDRHENKFIYKNCMDTETVLKLIEYVSSYNVIIEVYINGNGYFSDKLIDNFEEYNINPSFINIYKNIKIPTANITEIVTQNPNDIEKINIPWIKSDVRSILLENLKKDWNDKVYITSSLNTNIEICGKTTNKGDGLTNLCKLLNIKPEEVIVFGDNFNDLEMLQFAGTSVVMENGEEEIKNIADFVTLPNTEGGVGYAIEKYCL